jgi:LacI family transcriptional regulator/LacI family asc operon transcriptional repressor
MRDEGYTPNAFARGLGLNSMRMVGILCRDVANPFYGLAVSQLERNLRHIGYDSLLCSTGPKIEDKQKCLTILLQKRVDAIILVGSAYREKSDNSHIVTAAAQTPIFMLNAELEAPNVFSVFCNENEAMRDNVKYLVSSGYRDVLYLHDMTTWAWAGTQKLAGYKQGLIDCGISLSKELICSVELGIETARDKVADLLNREIPFTGIITSEDLLAVGAQKALYIAQRDIPIIGFNNSLIATCSTPSLTSVDNRIEDLCSLTINMLGKVLSGEEVPHKTVLSTRLVERETFCRRL